MLHSSTSSTRASSAMSSSCGPVNTDPPSCAIPRMLPMATAVSAWSPVIILTTIPPRCASSMEGMHSSRGGSRIATTPSMVRNLGRSRTYSTERSEKSSLASTSPMHSARTRSPRELSAVTFLCHPFRSTGLRRVRSSSSTWSAHRLMSLSAAPFTSMSGVPSGIRFTVAMNLWADSNGMDPSRSRSCFSCLGSMPILRAATRMATSVGLPLAPQTVLPVFSLVVSRREELLQSEPTCKR
mmetsp:Transcript_32160/g.90045  ORF Transcript_32160/g.90045 Transcript_32160/m.90045 type:complete len:240 (-) Transcript_32160:1169-1888(-)